MNIRRKIQLAAVVTIANGAAALALLSPRPAFAGTCDDQYFCEITACGVEQLICNSHRPSGCVVAAAYCLPAPDTGGLCGGWLDAVVCDYAPA